MKGGLKDCIYSVTKSGWFDSICFQQWFGKYVLLGDDLALPFKLELIEIEEQKNPYVAILLPIAVDLLQPLDVYFFLSMKKLLIITWY